MNGRVCSLALLVALACLKLGAATPGKVQVEWSEANGEKWTIGGLADRETGRPMAKDTMFSVCSNTKTVTSALVLTFVEEGKLSLDDPVSKFFPEFKDSRVTVRHLLAHTSGLPYEADRKRCRDAVPLAEQVAIAAEKGVAYEPGTKYKYCGLGFSVAAAILEKIAGRPFEVLMKERIFDPLEMKDATFRPTKEQQSRIAVLYYYPPDGGDPVPCGFGDRVTLPLDSPARVPAAAGGLFATAEDFLKFSQMIALKGVGINGRRILSEKTFENEFLRRQTPPGDPVNKSFDIAFNDDGVSGYKGGAHGTHCLWNWGEKSCCVTFVAKAPRPKGNAKAAIDATGFDGGRATFACSDVSRKGDAVSVKVVNVDDRHGANIVVLRSGGKVVASKRVELRIGEAKTVRFDVGGLAPEAEVSVGLEK